jgi:hypothetical protein
LSERHSRKFADLAMSRTWQTRVLPPLSGRTHLPM